MTFDKNDGSIIIDEEVALVPVKKDISAQPGAGTQLADMYDHYQKKLYLFDRSGSMDWGMMLEDEEKMYKWTPEILERIKNEVIATEIAAAVGGTVVADPTTDPDYDPDADPDDADADDQAAGTVDVDEILKSHGVHTEDDLKKFIIQRQLHRRPGFEPERDYSVNVKTERKIDAVRGAMKKFVQQRFKKYPDAQVGMIGFGSSARIMCYPGAPEPEVTMAIESIGADMGGTDLVGAITHGINEFKKRPSHVQSHHMIMVTDAEALMSEAEMQGFLRQFKNLNIMFDFIWVKGQAESGFQTDSAVDFLKKMCEATGGEFHEISKSSDFETKFLDVSNRKALPPARGL